MNVKIDIHKNNKNISLKLENLSSWEIPNSVQDDLKQFTKDLEIGEVNKGNRASERTQVKYLTLLKIPLEFFNKPVKNITKDDLKSLDEELAKGGLKIKRTNKPYSNVMKVDIRKALRTFLRWKLGEEKANALTDFLDTKDIKKTIDYLSESEIEKLYKSCKSNTERYIIAILFDSGARAEEFLNLRYEDLQTPEGNTNFARITIKTEYSKTEGRTISLYWKYSNEAIFDFIKEREREGIKSDEQILNLTYDNIRFFLRRIGLRILNKRLHFHLFRHSSATYYATRMNRQELCYRYGWKFSSDMPDVYISRSGMLNKELDNKFTNTELSEVKAKLEKEKFERDKEINSLKEQMKLMKSIVFGENHDGKEIWIDVKNKNIKEFDSREELKEELKENLVK